ncbi:transposase family protein [Microcoleus sp. FACHB-1515]|uniref:transposase family protein n=1 Tax=Cyanophyceae TaxID=3028117 RepID=UPI0018F010C3|nr:transposase family protein [Microcoleus sp. FACHB-1515]
MRYKELNSLGETEFKRLCGVSRSTFGEMVEVSRPHLERQGQPGGQNKLDVEDQLLITLEYWREYRSQFHIGVSWGVHETTVGRIVKKVEDLLVKCGKFCLPNQRQMYQPRWEWKVMMVDVSEMEIKRLKKTRNVTTVANINVTR